MNINLKSFQIKAINDLNNAVESGNKNIVLESGTGSGKTIILTNFISDFLKEKPDYAVVWFCPGKGNLEEQSKSKMDRYIPSSNTKNLEEVLNQGFLVGDVAFINWELVTKSGNRAISDGEYKNLFDRIEIAQDQGIKFLVIIDEEHLNKTIKSHDVIEMFSPTNIIRASATPKKDKTATHIQIPDEEIVKSGLVKRLLVVNEDIENEVELENQTSYLLNLALKKQQEIKEEFIKRKVAINPLIIIQIPNKSEKLISDVEQYLDIKGLNYENNQLAVWLSEKKENLEGVEEYTSPVKAIIIKQAIATGWDCPRSYILVKLRDNMSETFEIQTIGRIRRMPEAKHYDNNILDNCYLYTFDEKYKEGVKDHLGYGALEAMTLFLKEEHKDFKLKKQKISALQYEINPINVLKTFEEFMRQEYGIVKNKFDLNRNALLSYGYNFETSIKVKTYKGKLSSIHKKELIHLNQVTVKMLLDTHQHGRDFHHTANILARSIGLTYDSMTTIIRRLFCKEPFYKGKVIDLELKELYAFVINNSEILERNFKKAISSEKYNGEHQMTFTANNVEEEFTIPRQVIFTYDKTIHDFESYSKNVYDGYISTAIPRSQGEKLFERFCNEFDNVEWFYKNGDKGTEYFSIVYSDNSSKKHHFYPDYIVSINGEVWIIEVKGGEGEDGKSEDIDLFSYKKMMALIEYTDKYKIKGGFVRYNKADMRLYISTTEYTEHMTDKNWIRIDKFFM